MSGGSLAEWKSGIFPFCCLHRENSRVRSLRSLEAGMKLNQDSVALLKRMDPAEILPWLVVAGRG